MAKEEKKSKGIKLDFGDVPSEIRKRGRKVPEGDYLAKIVKAEKKWKDNDKTNTAYFTWQFQIVADSRGGKKYAGVPIYNFITSLKPDALFNLRNLIFAASDGQKNVAGKSVTFDPANLYGKQIGITVEDDEYTNAENKTTIRSRAADVMPPSQLEASDDDEEEEDDDEEDDEDDDEDTDDDDEEETDDDDEDELEDVDLDEDL